MHRKSENRIECRHRVEPPVEPEHKFVEVSLQMMLTDSVMRPKQPSFEIREGYVDHWQVGIGSFGIPIKYQRFVLVSQLRQVIISCPSICTHNGSLCHTFLHKSREFVGSTTWHETQSQPASINCSFVLFVLGIWRPGAHFDGSNDRRFVVDTAPFTSRAAAYKSLIHFNRVLVSNSISLWSHHAGTELVKHLECRLIAGQPQLPLKLECRLPWRLCRHKVSPPKPYRQGSVTGSHDGGRRKRHVSVTGPAPQHNRCPLGEPIGFSDTLTFRARETAWPTQMLQVSCAGLVIGKNLLKLRKCCWKAPWIHADKLTPFHQIGKQPDRQGIVYLPPVDCQQQFAIFTNSLLVSLLFQQADQQKAAKVSPTYPSASTINDCNKRQA